MKEYVSDRLSLRLRKAMVSLIRNRLLAPVFFFISSLCVLLPTQGFVAMVALLGTISAHGQTAGTPVLMEKTPVAYPPIARAAHVSGEVVVRFEIETDGSTSSVRVLSGPVMLQSAVTNAIKDWKFRTPLPIGAEREFEAVYRFGVDPPDESTDDDLDHPPYVPCCGDSIVLPPGTASLKGKVQSVSGNQTIDVTAKTPAPVAKKCTEDKETDVPATSEASDYAELFRACSKGCRDYKVRVYRDGRVEWLGRDDVAVTGLVQTNIRNETAEKLLEKFRSETFWYACSSAAPFLEQDRDSDDFRPGDYITVKIGEHTKTVNFYASYSDSMQRFVWAVDKTANTHRWIHGEAALEPFVNMAEDVRMPKPGITALIRATYHFSHVNAEMTQDALKRLLASPNIDVEEADESGWTALMYAAELTYDDDEIGMLLDAHASPNRASLHGDTALMMAAYGGRLSRRLLESGADINARNADGVTALMLLAQKANAGELKAAIAAGADVTAKDVQGRTALDYLREASCNKAIVPLPQPWVGVVIEPPPSCPSNTDEYKKSEMLLKAALKRKPQ